MDRPEIVISYAQSIDGRIATITGDSKWISGEATLKLSQELRRDNDAICVGIGTVLRDNPLLTCRIAPDKSPIRVIFDTHLRLPLQSKVVETAKEVPTWVFYDENISPREDLIEMGVRLIPIKKVGKRVDLFSVLSTLKKEGVKTLFLEGGQGMITTFIRNRTFDRLIVVTAPIFIGQGVEAVGNLDIRELSQAVPLMSKDVQVIENEIVWSLEYKGRA